MRLILILCLVILSSCSNEEAIKTEIESAYQDVKKLPASQPCANLEGYAKLEELEMKYRTTYFSDLTAEKIDSYAALCQEKKDQDALNARLAKLSDNMHILGFVTGMMQEDYPCKNFSESEQDGYNCPLNRSESDRLFFRSDPYTKLVGSIYRYTLIDKQDVEKLRKIILDRYGVPDLKVSTNPLTGREFLVEWGWGNVTKKYEQVVGNYIGKKNDSGKLLTFAIKDCDNIWFTDLDCPGLFGISENPNKVILELHLFGDESVINGEANRIGRDPREPKEYETIETKDVDEIDI